MNKIWKDRNINDKYIISSIDLSFGKANLIVYRIDGRIPHFHIISDSKESSLCIFDRAYYNHHKKYDILSKEDLIALNNFLYTKMDNGNTVWEQIRSTWCFISESKYDHKEDCENIKQPDYSKIGYNDRYIRRYII